MVKNYFEFIYDHDMHDFFFTFRTDRRALRESRKRIGTKNENFDSKFCIFFHHDTDHDDEKNIFMHLDGS